MKGILWILSLLLAGYPAVGAERALALDARIAGFEILTPEPDPEPRINGAKVYGCTPGKPFVYRIPTTGERPIRFSAEALPDSLSLNPNTGIITGVTPSAKGTSTVILKASNRHGSDEIEWRLKVGDTLALTPPMGWNHWYTLYHFISDDDIRMAADAMVESGMADVGYQFVSIDDCWMRITQENFEKSASRNRGQRYSAGLKADLKVGPVRKSDGTINTAVDFPDMKALTDYLHRKGLKAGIYTSPGPFTCQLFEGSYQHEAIDAQTFADWGFDLLKYDLCGYRTVLGTTGRQEASLEAEKEPYLLMGELLRRQNRDILLNLCQYGRAKVWEWGKEAGHSWRTGGDLGHTLLEGGVYAIAEKTIGIRQYNGPGGWNDPDYLILGQWRNSLNKAGPTTLVALTPNEQYSYFSLWCLMASPLFFSGDMAQVDAFTHNLLCNPEMIAVNQDPLGLCAEPIRMDKDAWILKKPLEDGSVVVGIFDTANQGDQEIRVSLRTLGIPGVVSASDLWRHKDLGTFTDTLKITVGPRGCAILKLTP